MLTEPDMLVHPVEGHDDLVAFHFGFGISAEGKAVNTASTIAPEALTENENGDLIIEGWAANFDGIDREGENFQDGAFPRAIKAFLGAQRTLAFHHKHDHGIGSVLDLEEVEGKGLRMKARVDYQPESSPLRYIYNGIKKGTYKGLSVGGIFKRAITPLGPRIVDMDFTEISVTPVPVHAGTGFNVVAGKALAGLEVPEATPQPVDAGLLALQQSLEGLVSTLERLPGGKARPTDDSEDSTTNQLSQPKVELPER
jgi:HK97 family phage prohead protease